MSITFQKNQKNEQEKRPSVES